MSPAVKKLPGELTPPAQVIIMVKKKIVKTWEYFFNMFNEDIGFEGRK